MHIIEWVRQYGYWAVFIGSFLEGEAVLLIASFAAYQGYLSFFWVVALSMGGSFAGDQLYFLLGKHYAPQLLRRFPGIEPRIMKIRALMQRYHRRLIFTMRFLYGLRIAGPIAIGMSDVTWRQYTPLNFFAALLWALAVGALGYVFGSTLALVVTDLRRIEEGVIVGIALLALIGWWLHYTRRVKLPWHIE
ncbi:DedA family protein [Candidatus Methylospira mobilis]|uniref:DedA family protein n=1 Tax=Candidatus Methylospira mobilis TaxID=1808979 RepID=A0A5Q0BIK5_9GAMM|nr:DedA family protein [Candidatus Methylospira mobilis]QFY43399.1 DedA family protein [Candidatus Methylospira mobilis]WNV03364.1 DedA family protein [Candidatus Methylospira mobilis]